MSKINLNFNGIEVSVNPHIEFLGAIFIIADFPLNKIRNNQKYVDEIKTFLKKHEKHDVVKKFKKMLTLPAFKYDAPLEMILCFINDTDPSYELLTRANITKEEFFNLQTEFFDFYKETNFEIFFNSHIGIYQKNINDFIERLSPFSPHDFLFNFIKLKSNNLKIVLMHSLSTSNYGLMNDDNLYCFVRPYYLSRFDGYFDFAYDLPYVTTLILHEFAHSFINPLTDKFLTNENLINKEKLNNCLEINSYGTHYKTAINETIIRTIECIYVKKYFGESYEEFKQEYITDGFVHIPELEKLFENKPNKPINEYYNEILKIFY